MKTEDIAAIIERIANSFVKALTAVNARTEQPVCPPQTNTNCNFCNKPGHYSHKCLVATEYINAVKCQRDQQGKIILSNGVWIPCDMPGKCFKERIDKWHHRNPGQLAAGHLMYNMMSQTVSNNNPPVIVTRQTHPDLFDTSPAQPYALSATDRIASLKQELYQLRNRKFEPAARPATISQREPNVDIPDNPPLKKKVVRPEVVIPMEKPVDKPGQRLKEPPSKQRVEPSQPSPFDRHNNDEEDVVHPYVGAPDATYAPPVNRNYAAVPKSPPAKKPKPAYKTSAPVYDGKIATDVYDCAMATQVTLTQRELLSLSPEVRAQVREATSN